MRMKKWASAAACRILKLAGNPSTVEEAVAIVAERLLEGVQSPPTDLEALMPRLNVTAFEPDATLPISGELRKDGDGFKIVYSASLSQGRQRFTLAHELAHAVFESTGPNCPRYGRELERICDMLAGEILLPKQIFLKAVGEKVTPGRICQLARDFQTSLMATAIRSCNLCRVSVFQVENGHLTWGYGLIKSKHDLEGDRLAFQTAIHQAMAGIPGERLVFLKRRELLLQWTCMRGSSRAMFVLRSHDTTGRPVSSV